MRYQTLVPWIVLPLLPLIVGFVLLGLIDDPKTGIAPHLPGTDDLIAGNLDLIFFNAFLPYLSVTLFHVAACIAVIVHLGQKLLSMPKTARDSALWIFGATMILLVLIGVFVRSGDGTGALNIGYRYVCMVLSSADVAGHILPTDCTADGLSRLAWLALLPVIAGLVAAALASAVTSTCFAPLDATEPEEVEADLARRGALIEQAFKAVAFVLVTSILALVIFYRLPLAFIDEDKAAAALWTGYAQGVTLYWGVLFTLTLVCIFGPGTVMLNARLRESLGGLAGLSLPDSLNQQATRQQVINILTTLAPLLIGASGSVLETIAGAL